METTSLGFVFTLAQASTVSAGVYQGKTLIRTLFSGQVYARGKHTFPVDGLTSDQLTVKLVANPLVGGMKYKWEGVVGNTSTVSTGPTLYHSNDILNGMVAVGDYMYAFPGYNEQAESLIKFHKNTPNTKVKVHPIDGITVGHAASDGVLVYWAGQLGPPQTLTNGIVATVVATDKDYAFVSGTFKVTSHYTYNVIGQSSALDVVNGLAVQKGGKYLFASYAGLVRTFDKVSGAAVQSLALASPSRLTCAPDGSLWVASAGGRVEKYTVGADGTLLATGQAITAVATPISLALSPDGTTLVIADFAAAQYRFFDTRTLAQTQVLGTGETYVNSPDVKTGKFFFANTKIFREDNYGAAKPFCAFQSDGKFWASDPGNYRFLRYSAKLKYEDQLAFVGYHYSCAADRNNPKRVFRNNLEIEVDYSKPLGPKNGSWKLVRNWSADLPAGYRNQYRHMAGVNTFANGQTFYLAYYEPQRGPQQQELVELTPTGLRFTGNRFPNTCQLSSDGSIWDIATKLGEPVVWSKRSVTGYDAQGTPVYSAPVAVVTGPPRTLDDPITHGGGLHPDQVTSTGLVISFCADNGKDNPEEDSPPYGRGWHLGGYLPGATEPLWKACPSTHPAYQGPFPTDGSYDIGNGVNNAGSFMEVVGRSIFWGYTGEFWKGQQTNMYNHFLDNGLFVGQFGVARQNGIKYPDSLPGNAGNATSGRFVKVGEVVYFYHCDEGQRGGTSRWKITGFDKLQEQTLSLQQIPVPREAGVSLMQGLPPISVVADGVGGWQRSAPESAVFSVKTNLQGMNLQLPDITVELHPTAAGATGIASHDLPSISPKAKRHTLEGTLLFLLGAYDQNGDLGAFRQVDDQGKIINQLSRRRRNDGNIDLLLNNTVVGTRTANEWAILMAKPQPLTLQVSAAGTVLRYADFPRATVPLYDATANWQRPAVVQVYLQSAGNREFGINLDLNFSYS
jgi:hypothetical protein